MELYDQDADRSADGVRREALAPGALGIPPTVRPHGVDPSPSAVPSAPEFVLVRLAELEALRDDCLAIARERDELKGKLDRAAKLIQRELS